MQTHLIGKHLSSYDELSFDKLDIKDTPRITDKLRPVMPGKREKRFIFSGDETHTFTEPRLSFSRDLGSNLLEKILIGHKEEWGGSIPSEQHEEAEGHSQNEETEVANRDRLVLLARQYESKKFSAEEEARLAILTERVRRLIPRVTEKDFEVLEELAVDLNKIKKETSELYRRIGINQFE